MESIDRSRARSWTHWAITTVEADANRSADTHLLPFPLPAAWGVDLYLKDESVHPTGSLKHRLARSLFLYAICNGWIDEGTTVIEASSGSTAVSEAYFARMLGLPFIAVMPASTSRSKIAQIEFYGGKAHLTETPAAATAEAGRLAAETGGHFMDQFTYAERATDWRGNNNIAESIFDQMRLEPHPVPAWIVVGAGTGGTSATIGRYTRFRCHQTRLCVADPEHSAYFPGWRDDDRGATAARGSRIEGVGRPYFADSFLPDLVDRMMKIDDADSIACLRWASERLGRPLGGSTGTNLVAALAIIAEMREAGQRGSIVTLLCDSGERYASTYFDDEWIAAEGIDLASARERLAELLPA
ncbi:PLP-dependent cysteine synthase family protein [Glycomyces sp. L485]|uniref:PLP-dependent cysteine synthase family protein n=1 Tax=Glycomyces sp. L485 TaxID=2909235 RepID=UPI001F4AEC42|nr:PLP-dependent cysteine synthase family protein [Glycomyces sp. L485]MCH7231786.1 PLP-dependent cysteine synthase family protein [Glycomyces sp. L485]